MQKIPFHMIWGVLLLLLSPHVYAFCFNEAGQRYHIDPILLQAIAVQESGMNATTVNHNRNRHGEITSSDYGAMQINSGHIPELLSLGVIRSSQDLLDNACLNVEVGAWVLARIFRSCGVNWSCLGAYNAGFKKDNPRRLVYARKVYAIYRQLKTRAALPASTAG